MLLQACVNGARPLSAHTALSADPEAVAAEARAAVRAGAHALHVHPKDRRGDDSLAGPDVDRFVAAARRSCPGVPIGVTTGAWAAPETRQRLDAIGSWSVLPDYASVNWHEDGADEVAALLLERGIGVEAGIWNEDGLRRWQASGARGRCLRALVELPDLDGSDAPADVVARCAQPLVAGIRAGAGSLPILLHGEERSTWAAVDLARHLGLDTRIGLEDTLLLPDGSPATGNEQLVRAAVDRVAG